MYEQYYGFAHRPFQLLPDPTFLYRSNKHEKALTLLEYGLFHRTGFIVISGEIGTGKTTLIRHMLRSLDKDKMVVACLSQTNLKPEEFLRVLCQEYSLLHEGKTKTELIELLGIFLIEQFEKEQEIILIVDEAQNLSLETLEEIRMLSNLDADSEPVLQIILVGQPSLRDKLRGKGLQQLSQRITLSYHLEPLERDECRAYIRHRIEKAGGADPELFEEGALELIYNDSGGVPRLINAVCDTCLVYGMAEDLSRIDRGLVKKVIRDRASWDLFSETEPSSCEQLFTSAPAATDLEGFDRRSGYLEEKLHQLVEISTASQKALAAIAEGISKTAGLDEMGKMQEKLIAAINDRQALEHRLVQLEQRLEEMIDSQNQPLRLLQDRNKEPISFQKGTDKISVTNK